METKFIEQDVFEEIQKRSFTNVEKELVSAGKVLSKLAGKDLNVCSVNEDYVVYNTSDNPDVLLKATYEFTENDTVKLRNFEKFVVDENSKIEARHGIIRGLVESLYNDDTDSASELWNKISISEMVKSKIKKDLKEKECKNSKKNMDSEDQTVSLESIDEAIEEYADLLPNYNETKKHLIKAAVSVAENVCEKQTGEFKLKLKDIFSESKDKEEKEIEEVEIDLESKKDSKKKTSEKSKKHRDKVKKERKKLSKKKSDKESDKESDEESDEDFDDSFEDEVVDIKRKNNAQDKEGLEESLLNIVLKNPSVLYFSASELQEAVKKVLTKKNEKNWNDELCEDIAYGLKKLAYNTYTEQVYDIIKYAATDEVWGLEEEVSDDDFEAFEEVSSRYFEDIYNVYEKQNESLVHLSNILAKTANILESDAKAYDVDSSKISGIVTGYREFASQIMAQTCGSINESLVKQVVGSLLSRVNNDYSLNKDQLFVDPGHFRKSFDLDGEKYKQLTKGSNKDSVVGDEEISISNPMSPKRKNSDELDLFKTNKTPEQNSGNKTNSMAPKFKSSKELDLD